MSLRGLCTATATLSFRMINLLLGFVLLGGSPTVDDGWASAYAEGVFEATVEYRMEHGLWFTPPPYDWYQVAGYIAVNDCTRVGEMATLIDPGGNEHEVLVSDCGGSDGGSAWMSANNIVAELDWKLWQRLSKKYPLPIWLELRYHD